MKRITTLASILLLVAPMALFAGNGNGRGAGSGRQGIHTPGTAQPGGVPQGTPGGQHLRDGSQAGTGQKKRQGGRRGSAGQNGQGQGQGQGQCQQPKN